MESTDPRLGETAYLARDSVRTMTISYRDHHFCDPRESGDLFSLTERTPKWIPAFAGMTAVDSSSELDLTLQWYSDSCPHRRHRRMVRESHDD